MFILPYFILVSKLVWASLPHGRAQEYEKDGMKKTQKKKYIKNKMKKKTKATKDRLVMKYSKRKNMTKMNGERKKKDSR